MKAKNCPFCGNEADVSGWSGELVACSKKTCFLSKRWHATDQWNTRADDWQPINTLPKNGTVLVRSADGTAVSFTRLGTAPLNVYWTQWRPYELPKPREKWEEVWDRLENGEIDSSSAISEGRVLEKSYFKAVWKLAEQYLK